MTLKELFDRCEFKDIAPYISQYYRREAAGMAQFKQAFDILRHTQPEADTENPNKKITVARNIIEEDLKPFYEEFPDHYIPVSVSNCWGDDWQSELAMEVAVSDEITVSDSEIAAHCLWQLTFWGFDQSSLEGKEAMGRRILSKKDKNVSNPYAVAAEKLSQRYWTNYEKYKKTDCDLDQRPRRNRAKRMRDHRQNKRIEKLERMARIEDAIRLLTHDSTSFSREELIYLFDTKLIYEDYYYSHSYDVCRRVDYLTDLFSNYVSDFSEYNRFILMVRTSQDYPLIQEEKDMLEKFFSNFLPSSANVRYGYGIENRLGTEAGLMLMCSR
jgi:hypothetical protein